MVNFIQLDPVGITIITNKVTLALDLQSIKNYIKNINCIDSEEVEIFYFSQSKSYLKIIGISYLQENMSIPITSNVVKDIIKKNHIFNNVVLALKPHIIKVFSKSDITIVSRSLTMDLVLLLL